MIHPKYSDKGIGMDPKDDESARVLFVNINQEYASVLTIKAYAHQHKHQLLLLQGRSITFDLIISILQKRLGIDNTVFSVVQRS